MFDKLALYGDFDIYVVIPDDGIRPLEAMQKKDLLFIRGKTTCCKVYPSVCSLTMFFILRKYKLHTFKST